MPDSRRPGRLLARGITLSYLLVLLLGPVTMVFYRTFEHGLAPVWRAISEPNAVHALLLSLELVAITVPLNTIFGVVSALILVRRRLPGRALLEMLIDLPFAVSPVIVGLALLLVYGHTGWLGSWLEGNGVHVIFSLPGMVLATAFVSLPFVARETIPVLQEIGTDAELAAQTLGAGSLYTFRRITLPALRWAITYGVVLTTARVLGEFGALSVISGNLQGETQTLTLLVQNDYENFNLTGAYAAAVVLATLALATLLAMSLLAQRVRAPEGAATDAAPERIDTAATAQVAA